ncbi:MAG: hypothetical protein ACOZCL_10850 [Bacillota bacterium]
MEENFHSIVLDALTEALAQKRAVTIKNNVNNCIIVITATKDEIIVSVSKVPYMVNEIITVVSEALNSKPDMVFNRLSVVKEDFIIYYMVWLRNEEQGKRFIEKEFTIPQNNITYLSPRAIDFLKNVN